MVSQITFLALVSSALALQVTSPDKTTVWTAGSSETIKWDTVSSDESTFNVYLSNMVSYPPTNILLASDVATSDGSLTIDGSALVAGNSFTINFTNGTKTEQLYAQSNQFNITAASTDSSSSSSSSSSTATTLTTAASTAATASTAASTAKSSTSTGTASSSSGSASTGSASSGTASGTSTSTGSSASSTAATATSGAGKVVAGWVGVSALFAAALAL